MDLNAENILKHYGILGQKWGVRRKSPSGPPSQDHSTASSLAKKKPHELSNDELNTVLKRIRLEKEYNELTSSHKGAGQKWVESILSKSSKKVATDYTTKIMSDYAEVGYNRYFKTWFDSAVKSKDG